MLRIVQWGGMPPARALWREENRMEMRVDRLTAEEFAGLWNRAGTLEEVVAQVRERVGLPSPRWAVLARAAAVRRGGIELKSLTEPGVRG